MNSAAFGPQCWDFLHQAPWNFPSEILSKEDAIVAIRFSHGILDMLPCKYCRESAAIFEKELNLLDSLSFDVSGVRIVTRSKWAKHWYDFHNKVNHKLEKPKQFNPYGTSWTASLKERPEWIKSMWSFLFAVCWNYPETSPGEDMISKYYTFFAELLPSVLVYTDVGKQYAANLKVTPLTYNILESRLLLCKWIYGIRCGCTETCYKEAPWSYEDVDILMEAFRARSTTCTKPPRSSRKQMIEEAHKKKSCQ